MRVRLLIHAPKWEQGSPFQTPIFQAYLPLLHQKPGAKEARFPQFQLPAKRSGSVWLTRGVLETKNELKAQTYVAHQNARVFWCCSVLLIAPVNLN